MAHVLGMGMETQPPHCQDQDPCLGFNQHETHPNRSRKFCLSRSYDNKHTKWETFWWYITFFSYYKEGPGQPLFSRQKYLQTEGAKLDELVATRVELNRMVLGEQAVSYGIKVQKKLNKVKAA